MVIRVGKETLLNRHLCFSCEENFRNHNTHYCTPCEDKGTLESYNMSPFLQAVALFLS